MVEESRSTLLTRGAERVRATIAPCYRKQRESVSYTRMGQDPKCSIHQDYTPFTQTLVPGRLLMALLREAFTLCLTSQLKNLPKAFMKMSMCEIRNNGGTQCPSEIFPVSMLHGSGHPSMCISQSGSLAFYSGKATE
jgi:hypothetical protein